MKFNKMKLAALAMSALMAASTVSPAVYAADLFSDGTAPAEEVFISEEPEVVAQEAPAVEEVTEENLLGAALEVDGASIKLTYNGEPYTYEQYADVREVKVEYRLKDNPDTLDVDENKDVPENRYTADGKINVKPATCLEAGYVEVVWKPFFAEVDRNDSIEILKKTEHDYKETAEYEVVKDATSHTEKVEIQYWYECSICHDRLLGGPKNEIKEIPASHVFMNGVRYLAKAEKESNVVVGTKVVTIDDVPYYEVILKDGKPQVKKPSSKAIYYEAQFCVDWEKEFAKGDQTGVYLVEITLPASSWSKFEVELVDNMGTGAKDILEKMIKEGRIVNNKVPLKNCTKDGKYQVIWTDDNGKSSAVDYKITAHHDEKELVQFSSETDKNLCEVTFDNGNVVKVSNASCKDIKYTVITYCANLDDACCNISKTVLSNVESDLKMVTDNKYRKISVKKEDIAAGTDSGHRCYTINGLDEFEKNGATVDFSQIAKTIVDYDSSNYETTKKYVEVPETSEYLTATCKDKGTATILYHCIYCDKVVKEQKINVNALGHTPTSPVYVEENYKAPTCTEAGSIDAVYRCERCKEVLDSFTRSIDPLKHTNEVELSDSRYAKEYVIDFVGDVVVDNGDITKESDGTYTFLGNGVGMEGYYVTSKVSSVCADCGKNKIEEEVNYKPQITKITEKNSSKFCGAGTISLKATYSYTDSNKTEKKVEETADFDYFKTITDYQARESHDWVITSETVTKEATAKETGSKTVVSTCTRCGFSKTATVEIPALGLPTVADLDITVAEKAVYTGEAVKAAVVVKSGDKTLVEGTDYDLAYSNNIECGKEAVVTITGKGDYQGTATRTFEIDPAEPVVTSAKSTGYNSVKVTWDAAAGAKSYRLYYRGGDATRWTLVRNGIKGTELSYASSDLVSGVTYRYTVVAVNGSVKSTFSAKGKCAAIKPAAPVANVTFSGKKAVVTWKKVAGANGYIIQSKAPNGKWTRVGTVKSGTKVTWTDKKAVSGTSYRVRVYRTVENVNVYGPFSAAAN